MEFPTVASLHTIRGSGFGIRDVQPVSMHQLLIEHLLHSAIDTKIPPTIPCPRKTGIHVGGERCHRRQVRSIYNILIR